MITAEELKKEFRNHGGLMRTAELNDIGLDSRKISRLIKNNILNRIKTGVYEFADISVPDLTKEYPDKLGSHISAAAVAEAADKLVSRWIFGDDGKSIEMAELIMENLEGRAETDIMARAYEFIWDWVMANDTQFTDDARPPRFGYCSDKVWQ